MTLAPQRQSRIISKESWGRHSHHIFGRFLAISVKLYCFSVYHILCFGALILFDFARSPNYNKMVLSPSSFSVCFEEKVVQLLDILTKPCSKSEQKFSFMSKPQLQICNKLLPTQSSSSTSATVTTSTSFELASLHARVASIKFAKRYGVSQLVTSIQ